MINLEESMNYIDLEVSENISKTTLPTKEEKSILFFEHFSILSNVSWNINQVLGIFFKKKILNKKI